MMAELCFGGFFRGGHHGGCSMSHELFSRGVDCPALCILHMLLCHMASLLWAIEDRSVDALDSSSSSVGLCCLYASGWQKGPCCLWTLDEMHRERGDGVASSSSVRLCIHKSIMLAKCRC